MVPRVTITGAYSMTTDASSASARMDSGSFTIGGPMTIELNNTNRFSVMDVNGGAFTVNDTTTGIAVGGTIDGGAELLVRGTGTATVGKITFGELASATSAHTLAMSGTSKLYVGSGGMVAGGTPTPTITFGGSSTLAAIAPWSTTLAMTLAGTPTIQAADSTTAAQNITLGGALSGSPTSLTVTGAGTLTLSAVNTFTSPIIITGGNLAIGGAGQLNSGAYAGNITDNGTFAYGSTANQTLSGIISGTGPVTQNGVSVLALSGPTPTAAALSLAAESYNLRRKSASTGSAGNLGIVPAVPTPNNIVLNNAGDLMATTTVTLNANRGIGIGPTSGSGVYTGSIDSESRSDHRYSHRFRRHRQRWQHRPGQLGHQQPAPSYLS